MSILPDETMPFNSRMPSTPECPPSLLTSLMQIEREITLKRTNFNKKLFALECQHFTEELQPLLDQRAALINNVVQQEQQSSELDESSSAVSNQNRFIAGYWLQVLQNFNEAFICVGMYDRAVLEKLIDIKIRLPTEENVIGFSLDFLFAPNDFFSNEILTKTYQLEFNLDEEDPRCHKNPKVVMAAGTAIQWKEGKSVKIHPEESWKIHSFFNYFKTVKEGSQYALDEDYKLGLTFKDRIIPMATHYFQGFKRDRTRSAGSSCSSRRHSYDHWVGSSDESIIEFSPKFHDCSSDAEAP